MANETPPEGYLNETRGRVTLLVREDLAACVKGIGLFEESDPARWKGADGALTGGRSRPHRIRLNPGISAVVKSLRRGGLFRFFNRSMHFTAMRLYNETRLTKQLFDAGVPVVPVLFGRIERMGLCITRLHLASQEVEDADSLQDLLPLGKATFPAMEAAGQAIRALHDAGVRHRDLNLGNLLVSPGPSPEARLIDLDRSIMTRAVGPASRIANLARLYRHAVKRGLEKHAEWKGCWNALLKGYCGDEGKASALGRDVDRVFRRFLLVHRLSWLLQGR